MLRSVDARTGLRLAQARLGTEDKSSMRSLESRETAPAVRRASLVWG